MWRAFTHTTVYNTLSTQHNCRRKIYLSRWMRRPFNPETKIYGLQTMPHMENNTQYLVWWWAACTHTHTHTRASCVLFAVVVIVITDCRCTHSPAKHSTQHTGHAFMNTKRKLFCRSFCTCLITALNDLTIRWMWASKFHPNQMSFSCGEVFYL